MTKKHYIKLAAMLREELERDKDNPVAKEITNRFALDIAQICAADNPSFNRSRFLEACEPKKLTTMKLKRNHKPLVAPTIHSNKPQPNLNAGGWRYGNKSIKELLLSAKIGQALQFKHAFSRSEIASWYMAAKRVDCKVRIRTIDGATCVWKTERTK